MHTGIILVLAVIYEECLESYNEKVSDNDISLSGKWKEITLLSSKGLKPTCSGFLENFLWKILSSA